MGPEFVNTNRGSRPRNTNRGSRPVHRNWGPWSVNTNWEPRAGDGGRSQGRRSGQGWGPSKGPGNTKTHVTHL